MQKLTITKIEPKGTWEGQYGKMYESWVTLSDGREGSVNSKTEGTWKVGDAVEVKESQPGKYGLKFKLGKFQETEPGRGSSPDVQTRIDASWAIGQAISMGVKGKDIYPNALWLIEMRDAVIKHLQTPPAEAEAKPETKPVGGSKTKSNQVEDTEPVPF